jgi:hypothetical protein
MVLGLAHQGAAAIAVVGIDFVGLGGVFVYARRSNVEEARRKQEAVPDPSEPPPRASQSLPKGRQTPSQPRSNKKRRRR